MRWKILSDYQICLHVQSFKCNLIQIVYYFNFNHITVLSIRPNINLLIILMKYTRFNFFYFSVIYYKLNLDWYYIIFLFKNLDLWILIICIILLNTKTGIFKINSILEFENITANWFWLHSRTSIVIILLQIL